MRSELSVEDIKWALLIIGILMVAAGTWMILSQYVFTFRIRR